MIQVCKVTDIISSLIFNSAKHLETTLLCNGEKLAI